MNLDRVKTIIIVFILLCALLSGCGAISQGDPRSDQTYAFIDDLGNEVILHTQPQKVVALTSSLAEIWLLSGGSLYGVTEDTVGERALVSPDDMQIIGTAMTPNLEVILGLSPDFILLSADIAAQTKLSSILQETGIPHAFFREASFEDYRRILNTLTELTEKPERYVQYGTEVSAQVKEIIARVPERKKKPAALILRGTSSKIEVMKEDSMVGMMAADMGIENLASRNPSILTNLSMEAMLAMNPDYLFIVTMGDSTAALQTLQNDFMSNPAWQNLDAARNGHVYILPKALFHYKPNAKWAESYAYLEKILDE